MGDLLKRIPWHRFDAIVGPTSKGEGRAATFSRSGGRKTEGPAAGTGRTRIHHANAIGTCPRDTVLNSSTQSF